MNRASLACLLATIALATFSSEVRAAHDDFGTDGQFIIGGNRLVTLIGFESFKTPTTVLGQTTTTTHNQWTLAASSGPGPFTFFTIPRLGADYVVGHHVTVGLDLLAWTTLSRGTDFTSGSVTTSTSQAKQSLLGVAPRVGYAARLTDVVAFWPRAGVSFAESFTGGSDSTTSQFAVDLEALLVLSPAPHFSITLGPVFDIPITGTQSTSNASGSTTTSVDSAQFYGGLTLGLLGWL